VIGIRTASALALAASCVLAVPAAADDALGPIATGTATVALPSDAGWAFAANPNGRTAYLSLEGQRGAPGRIAAVDAAGPKLVKTFTVGENPVGVAVTPDGRRLVASSWQDKGVRVLDARTGKLLRKVAVGGQADAITIGPKGSSLFVYVIDQGYVAKIDLKSYKVTGRYPLASKTGKCRNNQPTGMAVSPDSSLLLVSCDSDGLKILSTANGKVLGSIDGLGGDVPTFSPDGRLAYWGSGNFANVADLATYKEAGAESLWIKGDGSLDGVESPIAYAATPDGAKVYATMPEVGEVSILDPATGNPTGRVTVGGKTRFGANNLLLSPNGSRLYVTTDQATLITIDTATDSPIGVDTIVPPIANGRTNIYGLLQLAGSKLGVPWGSFSYDSDSAGTGGFTVLTMP
jgi:DNA-binding beta-propeller fold protein YncE